jgi:hypothetical protein
MNADQRREYNRAYQAAHREELNAYKAEWARTQRRLDTPFAQRQRESNRRYHRSKLTRKAEAMAAADYCLHDLGCPYPVSGCNCRVLVVLTDRSRIHGGTP